MAVRHTKHTAHSTQHARAYVVGDVEEKGLQALAPLAFSFAGLMWFGAVSALVPFILPLVALLQFLCNHAHDTTRHDTTRHDTTRPTTHHRVSGW
jgi:hypothetical protein